MGIRAIGFGPSRNVGVIAILEEGEVRAIWCMPWSDKDKELGVVARLLHALGEDQHFLLVAWQEKHIVDLREAWEINNYLFGVWPDTFETEPIRTNWPNTGY